MKKILIILAFLVQVPSIYAFELDDFTGVKVNLEDKLGQGKWTLLMFWAHDCGVCRTEFPSFSDFNIERDDVDVIGISIDGEANQHLAQEFLDATKPSFQSYITNVAMVAVNYEVLTEENFRGTPTFLLFKPDGTLLGNNPGKLSITALEGFIDNNS